MHRWIGNRLACWILYWWMTWIWLRVACWRWRARIILWEALVAISSTWSLVWATHVVFFSALWTYSSKSSKPWWSFIMIIVVSWLSNWSSVLCNLVIWVQIYRIDRSIMVDSVMLILVSLSKLVKNRSGSFCINCWDLSHNLATCCMAAIIVLCSWTTSSLCWTDLWWTYSFIISFIVISPVWRASIWLSKLRLINLLIIMNSDFLELLL